MTPKRTTTPMSDAAIKVLVAQSVADVLAEHEANRSRNGDNSHDSGTGSRRTERVARECTYIDFLKCQPINFKGTKGVFATFTLLGNALTWWNFHVKTIGHDATYGMPWKTLKKMITDNYNQRFQKLALVCSRMFPEESDEVEKYVGGLPDMIQGSVMDFKTKTMQDAIEFSTELMDQKIWPTLLGLGRRKSTEDLNLCSLNATTITMGSVLPSTPTAKGLAIWPGTCVARGHLKRDCPKLKNNNRGNQVGNGGATTMAYAVGNARKNSDANVVMGTFLLNNHYASILFDTGYRKEFCSTGY
ncbi:hypothetical protein Tco_1228280 [Tanacetum coccineum]